MDAPVAAARVLHSQAQHQPPDGADSAGSSGRGRDRAAWRRASKSRCQRSTVSGLTSTGVLAVAVIRPEHQRRIVHHLAHRHRQAATVPTAGYGRSLESRSVRPRMTGIMMCSPGPARRGWPGPAQRGPLCWWPAAAGPGRARANGRRYMSRARRTVRMRTRSACVIVPHPEPRLTAPPAARPAARRCRVPGQWAPARGRCARNDSARRVCRPVMDEHATSLAVDLGPEEGPPGPRPGAA